jgi:hypothetical protein
MLTSMLLAILTGTSALAADGPAPVSEAGLNELLAQAEASFIAFDKEGVLTAVASIDLAVPCLDELASVSTVARLHTIEALGVFLAGEPELAQRYFAAANVATNGQPLSEDLVPAGHPLQHLYVGAGGLFSATESLPDQVGARIYIYGTETSERPVERPVLVQRKTWS